ncbi:hypothetical protein Gohar_026886, partial [Gossypium harknessii]|nr:hypothetical protein [Gossypium harknessii]
RLIHFVILLLNLSLNDFGPQTNHALVEDYHKEKIYLLVQDLNEVHD